MSKEISNNGRDYQALHKETKGLFENTTKELHTLKPTIEKGNDIYTTIIVDILTNSFGVKDQDLLDIKAKLGLRSLKNEKEIKGLTNTAKSIIDSDFGIIVKIAFEILRIKGGAAFINICPEKGIFSDQELLTAAIKYQTIKDKGNNTKENENFTIGKQTLKYIIEDLSKYAPKKETTNGLEGLTSGFSEENRIVINTLVDKDFEIKVSNGTILLSKNGITTEVSKSDKLSFANMITLKIEPADGSKTRTVNLLTGEIDYIE